MPRVTPADLRSQDPGEGAALLEALSPLATGVNPDGSPFSMGHTGLLNKWRDEFGGAALKAEEWTASSGGTGASISVSGSNLVLVSGTSSGAFAEVVSKRAFYPGVRLYATLAALSQRVANQEAYIELVEDGAAFNAGSNRIRWEFTGTVNTTASFRSWSQGDASAVQSVTGFLRTDQASVVEIDLGHEEAWGYDTLADNAAGRAVANRLSRKVPDPLTKYRVRIGIRNVAAAASTTMTVDSVLVEDYSFNPVEIVRSRGSNTVGEAMPVISQAGGQVLTQNGSLTSLAPRASGGLSVSVKKAGSTGAPLAAKTSAGHLYGVTLTNTTATTRFLKLFNLTAATLGTNAPLWTIPIPAGQTLDAKWENGLVFGTGITWAITAGVADLDTAVSAADEVIGFVAYA